MTVRLPVVSAPRDTVKVPVLAPVSDALESVAVMVTVGLAAAVRTTSLLFVPPV